MDTETPEAAENALELTRVAQGGKSYTVTEVVKTNLQQAWEQYSQGKLTREQFARSVTIIGGKGMSRLPEAAVDNLYVLIAALRIPPRLHGTDLIQAMAFGGNIAFHVTIEGELAVAIQDPRLLLGIDVDVQVTPTEGGAFHTCTATVRYRGVEVEPGVYESINVAATDSVVVSNWSPFMATMQSTAAGQALAAMGERLQRQLSVWQSKGRKGPKPQLLNHNVATDAVDFLGQVQKKLNRHNQFLVRTCRTKALMLALREARGRIAIVPMVDGKYEQLNRVDVQSRDQLVRLLAGMGYTVPDILDAAAVELGVPVALITDIPEDDTATLRGIYQRLLME